MPENTLRPIWTPDDFAQTVRDARRHRGEPAVPCQCESLDCRHKYLMAAAGDRRAMYVGPICDECADTHMAPYVEGSDEHRAHRDAVLDRTLAELEIDDTDDDGDQPVRLGMRPRRARRLTRAIVAAAVVVLVLALGTLWAAQRAEAMPADQCVDQFWLVPFQANRRTICDGPIQPDGSWVRLREFYTPAHDVPLRTYCTSGSYSSSCTTSGGYWQPRTSLGIEAYRVTADTVLADEPGHIGLSA